MNQIACFMVTEPSVDEELVPKNEDENGNQEILMDQVFYNDANDHDALEKEKKEGEETEEKEVKEEEKLMEKITMKIGTKRFLWTRYWNG